MHYTAATASDHVVTVRWRNNRPNNGYDLWDGETWLPISDAEFQSYRDRGFAIHMNPRWSGRC